jgi:type I restriction enzyme M protein
VIQDPAAGTGGFLIAANLHTCAAQTTRTPGPRPAAQVPQRTTFFGMELVQDTHRLALMNLMLHGIDSDPQADPGPAASATATP